MHLLEYVIVEGLIIDNNIMQRYFIPVLLSLVERVNQEKAFLMPLIVSVLTEVNEPPAEKIFEAFKGEFGRLPKMVILALEKKEKLLNILGEQRFESVFSRAIFSRYPT